MNIQDQLKNRLQDYLGEWPEWKIQSYAKAHDLDETTALIYLSESFLTKHRDYTLDFLLTQFKSELAEQNTPKAA